MKRMEENMFNNDSWDDIDSIATEARQVQTDQSRNHWPSQPYLWGKSADISILMVYLEGKIRAFQKI